MARKVSRGRVLIVHGRLSNATASTSHKQPATTHKFAGPNHHTILDILVNVDDLTDVSPLMKSYFEVCKSTHMRGKEESSGDGDPSIEVDHRRPVRKLSMSIGLFHSTELRSRQWHSTSHRTDERCSG